MTMDPPCCIFVATVGVVLVPGTRCLTFDDQREMATMTTSGNLGAREANRRMMRRGSSLSCHDPIS